MENKTVDIEQLYQHLEETVRQNNPTADLAKIRKVFEVARDAHSQQIRKDGSPYIIHPLAAAEIIAEMGLDDESIEAALLHDTIEDTDVTYEDIERMFGKNVANIVEGVTKLTRVKYTSKEEEQMDNLRKMLLAMAKDIRVIIIKLADRLHNMRTMEYQSPKKQREKSLETMEIYAPIAHRLGMQKIKWELEDRSIYFLDPIGYKEIQDELSRQMADHEDFFNNIQNRITQRLRDVGIECTVYGRIKHIYSIYRKMYSQNKSFSEVLDLFAFRVIVNDIADCYNVLGYIHEMFRPIPGKFKDYIGTPKPNMYQSLHTTVLGTEGIPFEVQIRTWQMHHTAEYGIAAHWKYKEGKTVATTDEEKFAWIRRLLESQQDADAQDFFHDLKTDMFADEVFVFTPNGDVISLPAGPPPSTLPTTSTPPWATDGGRQGQRADRALLPRAGQRRYRGDHHLQRLQGPQPGLVQHDQKLRGRNKIRMWFKKEKREENILHGKAAFEAELKRQLLRPSDITAEDVLPRVLKKLSISSLDDMYAAIGYGGMTAQKCVNRIKDEVKVAEKQRKKDPEASLLGTRADGKAKPVHGIVVEGIGDCLVKFARCCTPVPGDPAVGFVTRGYGVSIHRRDCKNYFNSDPSESGRWVDVQWAPSEGDTYQATLHISASERSGLILDIASIISNLKIKMTSLQGKDVGDGLSIISMSIEVHDLEELSAAVSRLRSVSGVRDIKRGDG
jgi:GTP pyrophosphokinase